jgi:DNA-binding MarR family transcriptional regulator
VLVGAIYRFTQIFVHKFIAYGFFAEDRHRNISMRDLRRRESTTPTSGYLRLSVDRLVERGLVSRVESPEDRRVRIVSLTPKGKELIAPIFRKHAAEIRKVFADASPKELRALETTLKKIGKRAESLGTGVNPKCLSQRDEIAV